MAELVNALGIGWLLAALYMLRFRAWRRPILVVAYFAFFATLEWIAARYFMPPGALPDVLGRLCFGLSLPVVVATWLVRRQEQRRGESTVSDD